MKRIEAAAMAICLFVLLAACAGTAGSGGSAPPSTSLAGAPSSSPAAGGAGFAGILNTAGGLQKIEQSFTYCVSPGNEMSPDNPLEIWNLVQRAPDGSETLLAEDVGDGVAYEMPDGSVYFYAYDKAVYLLDGKALRPVYTMGEYALGTQWYVDGSKLYTPLAPAGSTNLTGDLLGCISLLDGSLITQPIPKGGIVRDGFGETLIFSVMGENQHNLHSLHVQTGETQSLGTIDFSGSLHRGVYYTVENSTLTAQNLFTGESASAQLDLPPADFWEVEPADSATLRLRGGGGSLTVTALYYFDTDTAQLLN